MCKAKKPLIVLSALAQYERPAAPTGTRTIVHINGTAASLTPANVDTQIRLSSKSYAANDFMSSKWAQLLATDTAYSDATIFVGFSAGDLDIARILVENLTKHKTHFFNGKSISKMARAKLENLGVVHALNGEQLVNQLKKSLIGRTSGSQTTTLNCFERCRLSDAFEVANDIDRRDLLIYGRAKDEHIQSTLNTSTDGFIVSRAAENQIIEELTSGSDVAVLSALGNGKTILFRRISYLLINSGWDVYSLRQATGNWLREVEHICALKGKVAVQVDGAADAIELLQALGNRRGGNLRILIAERTRRYEARFTDDRLRSIGISDIVEHEIDLLNDKERQDFDGLLSSSGLWGRDAALTKAQRDRFLRNQCRNEISSALLHVVKSEEIAKRIRIAMDSDKLSETDLHVVSVAVALSVFGYRVPILDLARICGTTETNQLLGYSSEFRSRLYDTRGGEFRVNSKIFGQYFLRDLIEPSIVLDSLSKGIRAALRFGVRLSELEVDDEPSDSRDDVFIRTATSFPAPMYVFRNIQQIVDVESDFAKIFSFYESIKSRTRLSDDPLFWLQYAIAKLFSGDRASAKSYLENSYGIARRTGFRTYQIDNQYARWLLESAISTGNHLEAFSAFDEAHRIIVGQLADHSHAHYPFRIALLYRDYFLHHQHGMNEQEIEYVVNAANAVIAASQYAQVEISKRHWVEKCKRALLLIVEQARLRQIPHQLINEK